MFDNLTDKLHGAFRSLTGNDKLTAENIEEAIREVRKSLLEADVSLKVVKIFISNVRQKALGADVLTAVRPDQQFVKIVHDELVGIRAAWVRFGVDGHPMPLRCACGVSGRTTGIEVSARSRRRSR